MEDSMLVTCDSCGYIIRSTDKSCHRCGYDMPNIRIHNSSSPTGSPHKQYTYHIEESGEGGDVVGDDYGFPEVELTPPTLDELIATYTETLEQLKAENCLFFSFLYNPKSGKTVVTHKGFPEDKATSLTNSASENIPKPSTSKRFLKRLNKMTEEERMALPYACSECEFRTNYSWMVKHHMRTHTGEKPYSCPYCNTTTRDYCAMLKHKRRHENVTDYECDVCHTYWGSQRGLDCHKNLCHVKREKKDSYECEQCGKVYKSYMGLQAHKTWIHGKTYQCNFCAYKTGYKYYLNTHMKLHSEGEKRFRCPKCPYSNDHMGLVTRHIKWCHSQEVCEKSTSSSVQVRKLKKSTAGKPSEYQCYMCEFTSPYEKRRDAHIRNAHSKDDKPLIKVERKEDVEVYRCARCKRFNNTDRAVLEAHVQICRRSGPYQGKDKRQYRYHCANCDYYTSTLTPFLNHSQLFHDNSVEYKCPECDFVVADRKDYLKHRLESHTFRSTPRSKARRPVRKKDSKAPTKQGNWAFRRKRHVFEFKCDQCSFSSPDEQKLKHHKGFHTGHCFQCSWCGLVFSEEKQFGLHEQRHKREEMLKKRRVKRERASEILPGISVLSLTNHSAAVAIKNKYQGYQFFKLVTPKQAVTPPTAPVLSAPVYQTADPKPSLAPKLTPSCHSEVSDISTPTLNMGKAANLSSETRKEIVLVQESNSTPSVKTYYLAPQHQTHSDVTLASTESGSLLKSSLQSHAQDTSSNASMVKSTVSEPVVPAVTAMAAPPKLRNILPATVQQPTADLKCLTPQDKGVVRRRVAQLINSLDDHSLETNIDNTSKVSAPQLSKLLHSKERIKLKKLDRLGVPIVTKTHKAVKCVTEDVEKIASLQALLRHGGNAANTLQMNSSPPLSASTCELDVVAGLKRSVEQSEGSTSNVSVSKKLKVAIPSLNSRSTYENVENSGVVLIPVVQTLFDSTSDQYTATGPLQEVITMSGRDDTSTSLEQVTAQAS